MYEDELWITWLLSRDRRICQHIFINENETNYIGQSFHTNRILHFRKMGSRRELPGCAIMYFSYTYGYL